MESLFMLVVVMLLTAACIVFSSLLADYLQKGK